MRKTEHITSSSEYIDIEGVRIQKVNHFRYLGPVTQHDGSSRIEIGRRICRVVVKFTVVSGNIMSR